MDIVTAATEEEKKKFVKAFAACAYMSVGTYKIFCVCAYIFV